MPTGILSPSPTMKYGAEIPSKLVATRWARNILSNTWCLYPLLTTHETVTPLSWSENAVLVVDPQEKACNHHFVANDP